MAPLRFRAVGPGPVGVGVLIQFVVLAGPVVVWWVRRGPGPLP